MVPEEDERRLMTTGNYLHSRTNDTVKWIFSLRWRHNGLDGVSDHQPHDCLLSRLYGRRSKKTSKLRVTGLCAGNSPGTGEFPAQKASNAENVSIWWRHHVIPSTHSDKNKLITSKQRIFETRCIKKYLSFDSVLAEVKFWAVGNV